MERTGLLVAGRSMSATGGVLLARRCASRHGRQVAAVCPLRCAATSAALRRQGRAAARPGDNSSARLPWRQPRPRRVLTVVSAEDGSKSQGVSGGEKVEGGAEGKGTPEGKAKKAEEPLDRFVDEESKREMVWWRKIFLPLTWVFALLAKWPQWVARQKLAALREAAEAEPENVEKQLALLRELNKGINKRPLIGQGDAKVEEVVEHMRSGKYAANSEVVIEYLRALVHTGAVDDYSEKVDVHSPGIDHRSLTTLLEQLRTLSAGDKVDLAPGDSMRRPLHVVVEGGMLPAEGPFAVLRKLLAFAFFAFAAACIWLVGATIARKMAHSSSYTSGAPGLPGASMSGGSSSHAPKEYNKDTMPEKSVKTFKDVYGCDEAKAELEEIVAYLKTPEKFTRLGGKLPKGILLTGPPGTGKTLLARAVAGEAGVPFFYRAGSEFEEMFVGVGSRRVRSLFSAAKNKAPCIVFIDEIDAVGGNRKQWESHTKKTLNQMLVEMDGFEANEGIIVMAATNLPETLDPALTRPGRFDRHVAVPLPDVKGRLEILKHYMEDKPISVQVDRQILARNTPGFSGAKLANLVNEAALIAAKTNKDVITPAMLDEARDKIMMGVERKSLVQSLEARKLTAYHEGGHALVALRTEGANPIHKATIVPRGHALGMVTQLPDKDEFSITREQMLAYIDVCMGGKVAEELIFGEMKVTSGATQDLVQATRMARHMVADCGMSDLIGPMHVQTLMDHERSGGVLREHVDAEVARVLRESYERVKGLLTTNEQQLHTLAGALLEHETLTQKDIRDVLDGNFTAAPGEGPSSSDSSTPKQEEEENAVELEHIPAGAAASVISPSPPTSPVAA